MKENRVNFEEHTEFERDTLIMISCYVHTGGLQVDLGRLKDEVVSCLKSFEKKGYWDLVEMEDGRHHVKLNDIGERAIENEVSLRQSY